MEALKVQGLTRTFGKHTAVDNLSVTVEVGDIYGFLGPNGAGKTTAMRCMLGLLSPDQGQIHFFGDSDMTRARSQIGAIIEVPCFDDWMSGQTNLELSCAYLGLTGKQAKAEVGRVLERVGLTERAKDKAGTYSLGMRQRLGIARALLGKPKLLMLDEPTNGLDPRGMREVREFIASIAKEDGTTIFLSSHLLSEIQALCNRVGIIQNGQMRAEGTVDEFLSSQGGGWVEIESPTPDKVKALIQTLGWARLEEGGTSRIRARVTDGTIAQLNKALVGAGIDVEALIPTKASLEDVFLQVTT